MTKTARFFQKEYRELAVVASQIPTKTKKPITSEPEPESNTEDMAERCPTTLHINQTTSPI